MFTEQDIKQLKSKGIAVKDVEAQISRLKNGMTFSNLVAAANIGKGIESYDDNEVQEYINFYEAKLSKLSIVKFVPASGAATRMFKFLFQFLNNFEASKLSIKKYAERNNDALIVKFVENIDRFPFYNEVISKIKQTQSNFESLSDDEQKVAFVKTMLDAKGLNYSFLPKGLLPFHKYEDQVKTAFEEHLFESTLYAASNGVANLHFTVSKNHQLYFSNTLNKIREHIEGHTKTTFNVSFSYQNEATETVALTSENEVFRKKDGSILFRPAGHGALLENLNTLDNDIVFIKNIDNIVVADRNIAVSNYKKLLAGVLVEAQEKLFEYLHKLDTGDLIDTDFKVIALFLRYRLNVPIISDFERYTAQEKIEYLKEKLNRPIRVCGMVKNQGEPGGGPFWVKDAKGNTSLQIVEFAQINFSKTNQQGIVYKATHFNPTDLVCGIKNYKGEKFDLTKFVDTEAAFITTKTQNGVDIDALELPGLWNGSMAYWNSIFVEVPLETFNPVKTVNDLLKPVHQGI
ncbi:DUF4301 family protein [Algibacter amylolyticus]|uniref:DUF4301 family protein n=1 Tax=Algibacter amylolyticus TaxID=1608400 RepID=A0A5M7BET0_9FLAO|nr:DUF4301 family protein [Algibacter amylolyticus]KAA5827859.1 DUF4301 family protein [Algibacter amylolyticus]MBB5267089.1 hypothetical protein [Algibacter amylolyticus]TSJ82104.1 DUF4301 family protein [Algibacter amylolyticus]